MFVPVIVIAFVPNNGIVISALAVSSGSSGQVIQEAVNTSNPELDKQVNKFYDCVSKITHEPQEPGKAEVDNCYFQVFGGSTDNSSGITLPSNGSPLSVSNSRSNENSGQGSNTGNSGQIVSEGVHSKIVKQFR
ncbi:MAG: hypothetical protein DLM72_19525 [Candidatus Nitrosopolaris wilkensis]|nr:MAG: hypothetical protein DLM72_19525 [Candidatus Nitrosopolaris wilkensis]